MSEETITSIELVDKKQSTPPSDHVAEKPVSSFRNVNLTLAGLAIITVIAFFTFDTKNIQWMAAIGQTFTNLGIIFFQPTFSSITFSHAIMQVLVTFSIAFLTTIFSAILAFFMGLFAAQNIGGKRVSSVIRAFIALIRSIPTVLWVLIFAISAGLGSVAAVVGTGLHSLGYLVKMFSETFEEMDQGKIEALEATGASFWEIIFQAVLPTTIRPLLSWVFMRFEINYIVALGMGAAAGAGGLGFDLFMAGSFYYNMREVGAITYVILATCLLLELFSRWVKTRLATNE